MEDKLKSKAGCMEMKYACFLKRDESLNLLASTGNFGRDIVPQREQSAALKCRQ